MPNFLPDLLNHLQGNLRV